MIKISLPIALLVLASCTTTQKAIRQLDKDRPAAANYCADRFPVRDSISPGDTVYIPADNVDLSFLIDSLYGTLQPVRDTLNLCPDVVAEANRTILAQSRQIQQLKAQYRPCVPDTLRITGPTVYRENTARVAAQGYQIADLTAARNRYHEGRNWWRMACLITWGIVALFILFQIFKSKLMRFLPILLLATYSQAQTYITPSGDTVVIKGKQAASKAAFQTSFETLSGLNTQQSLPGGLTIENGQLRATVNAGGASVSSGWRAEAQVPVPDEGNMVYEVKITPISVGSGTGGHCIQWHPDNGTGSAVLSLWINGGVFTIVTNPSGGNSNTYTEIGKYTMGRQYSFTWNVNWITGDIAVDMDGKRVFTKTVKWQTGRYLKLGLNLFSKSAAATFLYDDLKISKL